MLPGYITAAEHQSHSVRLWSQSQQQVDSGSGAGKAGPSVTGAATVSDQPSVTTGSVTA